MIEPVTMVSGAVSAAGPVELLQALVATPSVNPSLEAGGSGESEIAALVAGWLGDWSFGVELVEAAPGRPSVLARLGPRGSSSLILNGHLDTVGVEGMTVPPFEATLRDGRLWGRGACDMKAGLAALLWAAREWSRGESQGELIVALTADEEEAGIGCRRLVSDGLRADAAIVCEPTNLAIMPAHKGFSWLALDFRGRAAHGSRPDRGVDAIRHAGLFLSKLDELESTLAGRAAHPLLGRGSIHAGTIEGGSAASVYPASCRLVLERRTLPGESGEGARSELDYLLGRLRSDVPELDAELEMVLHRDGSEIATDHELVEGLARHLERAGVEPRIEGMTAWVEAVVFNETGTPALCFGPGAIVDAHAADESVDTEEVETAAAVLATFVEDFLG